MYAGTDIYIYICRYVYMHVCITYVCMNVRMHVCKYLDYVYMHLCVCVCECMYERNYL